MSIKDLLEGKNVQSTMNSILENLHQNGPIEHKDFENLAYMKKLYPDFFAKYEKKLMYLIGLFYKTSKPETFLEKVYSIYADLIKDETGKVYTPIQANAYYNIKNKTYFSFSSPTSSGKSFLFRDLINECDGDIIIVVPSRALISEYIYKILNMVKKDVLVLQFIEYVNTLHSNKRIYVITPERGNDLFQLADKLNIKLFLFDESQISEEPIRGMRFDSLVRRINNYFPAVTKVFAHPFVSNPEAQLLKHNFNINVATKNYEQNVVGKIYIYKDEEENFNYFSPFEKPMPKIKLEVDIIEEKLRQKGTLLIYTSKKSIYEKNYLKEFKKYIDLCPKVKDPKALDIIKELKNYLGITRGNSKKFSQMIKLMENGIVIHHGSIPLKARLLIEKFVNEEHASICFATSTLTQGINMPFDIVWIDNFVFNDETEDLKLLEMKNLIGRAGRTTPQKDCFDLGYVIVNKKNVKKFIKRINGKTKLAETSMLDKKLQDISEDLQDIAEAIQTEAFDNDLKITNKQKERLQNALDDDGLEIEIKNLLDIFLPEGIPLKGDDYNNLSQHYKKKIKNIYQKIYTTHLRRKNFSEGEKGILSATIPILLWRIQGKSFKEIVSIRLDYISRGKEQREFKTQRNKKQISNQECYELIENLKIKYSPEFDLIPNQNINKTRPLFDTKKLISEIDYDRLIWDTYDYLDKVISWALADPLSATFILYFRKTNDERAIAMANYIKYGTNNSTEIWLLKYGFDFEEIEWLLPFVNKIDEKEIVFSSMVMDLEQDKFKLIERYVNNLI